MNSRAKHAKRKRALARSPKTRIPGLPDATLAELHDIAGALDENYIATNTERSYDSDWKTWVEFCSRHEINPLPAEVGDAVRNLSSVKDVKVDLTWDPPFSLDRMPDEVKLMLGLM